MLLAACFSCDGQPGDPDEPDKNVSTRLTTGRTSSGEQARADAYTTRAARYRQLAAENRQAVAALTADIAKQAEIATRTGAPVTADAPPAGGAVDAATISPAVVRSKRQAAAELADRMAATAQRVADLHTRRAARPAPVATGGRGGRR